MLGSDRCTEAKFRFRPIIAGIRTIMAYGKKGQSQIAVLYQNYDKKLNVNANTENSICCKRFELY